jgi:uncharacterized coiled-coil protein SlyX
MYRRHSDRRSPVFTQRLIAGMIVVIVPTVVHAQTPGKLAVDTQNKNGHAEKSLTPSGGTTPATDVSTPVSVDKEPADSEVADRLGALEEALKSQNMRIEEMQKTIREQQATIQALTAKVPDSPEGSTSMNSEKVAAAATKEEAPVQGQVPSTDDRLKKVESDILKIGRVRFSGDFRLRFDAILRKADPTPPPGFSPLLHQQNARMRYRFRLNMDTELNPKVSFHAQLATGPINNALTMDQDFTSTTVRHPFFISEAWVDFHPNKSIQLQAGRLLEVFADNSRFLFDDDIRFNGFNELYTLRFEKPFAKFTSIEFRAGQYIFSNPNVAIVTPGSPLAETGEKVGSTGRASGMFHQGVLFNQKFGEKFTQQFGGDVQLFRNQNQIQLASTTDGLALIIQPGIGLALSGPLTGTGNATTTPGGAIYTAPSFQVARITYKLIHSGFSYDGHAYPITFNAQVGRNVGTGNRERDALLVAAQVGRITKPGDMSFLYIFATKGANAMISQLTDDDLGTNSGVNITTHHLRFDYGITKNITLQNLLYIQSERRNSGDYPQFFVPLNAFSPRQYRIQEQIVFTF